MRSCGIDVGEAFSAGLGIALGLVMGQYMLEAMAPERKIVIKYVLLCRECVAQNPIENKFCGNCGRSLYPPTQTTCRKCGSKMPSTTKFCGNCGLALPK